MTSISPPEGQDKTLLELAERCEAAKENDPDLFDEAFSAVFPRPDRIWVTDNTGPWTAEYEAYHERSWAFSELLEARGYLDAAMTLVPEGLDFGCGRGIDTEHGPNKTIGHAWVGEGEGDLVFAETVALSLCAAALRALNQVRAIL